MEIDAEQAAHGKEYERGQVDLGSLRDEPEERQHEHQDRDHQRDRLPDTRQTQAVEVGFFRHVTVPDHQVLAEADVAEERGEREAELTQIPEVIHGHEVICLQMLPPPHGEERQRHDHVEPRAHEHDPRVHGLLEVQRDAHGVIPCHEAPTDHERHADRHRELALQGVLRVQLATLVAKARAHLGAKTGRPLGAVLREDGDVHTDGVVHEQQLQHHHGAEEEDTAQHEPAGLQVARLLGDRDRFATSPREDVLASREEDEQQDHERDRQERHVAFREADDWTRPASGDDALHGGERRTGRRDRGEEQPVEMQRLPRAIRVAEQAEDEHRDADHGRAERGHLDSARYRLGGQTLRELCARRIVVMLAH